MWLWCWHHIIEIAEKDKTEGKCPTCRSPYDKERIVGTMVSCERLVAELNIDRKKSQKVNHKPSEGRKDLTGVRVIQRNLVYVMSFPFDAIYVGVTGCCIGLALSFPGAPQALLQSCLIFGAFSFIFEGLNKRQTALAHSVSLRHQTGHSQDHHRPLPLSLALPISEEIRGAYSQA